MSLQEIQSAIGLYYFDQLEGDAKLRRTGIPRPIEEDGHQLSAIHDLRQEYRTGLRRGDFASVRDVTAELIEKNNLNVQHGSEGYYAMCQGLLRTSAEILNRIQEREEGNWAGQPADPLVASFVVPKATSPSETNGIETRDETNKPSFDELIEDFMTERYRSASPRSDSSIKDENEFRQSIEWFRQYIGRDRSPYSVKPEEVVAYKTFLLSVPKNFRKHFPDLDIRQAVEQNKLQERPTISEKTINNKRLGNLDTFFSWLHANRWIKENPARNIRLRSAKGSRETGRNPFKAADLNRLFRAPLFTGCKSSSRWKSPGDYQIDDHRYWLPLLALFTGARQGELAQLFASDVKQEDGIWFFDITDEMDDKKEAPNAKKSLKNRESKRKVPMHLELEKLGFKAYVSRIRNEGHDRLFPNLEKGADRTYSTYSKLFKRITEDAGIYRPGLVFHSFRHGFEDAMREAGIGDEARHRLSGRTLNHSSMGYGNGYSVKRLFEEISKVEYPGLDISHLHRN